MAAYVPLNWVDNVTDANAANMNHLEAGVAAALPKVAGAADPITGTVYFGALADTNLYRSAAGAVKTDGQFKAGSAVTSFDGNAFQITLTQAGFPVIYFGSSNDTNLYRVGAGNLRTDGSFTTSPPTAVSVAFGSALSTDAQYRWIVDASGKQQWGPGGVTAPDTVLERIAATQLRLTGSTLITGTATTNAGTSTGQGCWVGSGGGFAAVKTSALANCYSTAQIGDTGTWRLNIDGNGKMFWADGTIAVADTNLYRAAAGTLKTDGIFQATSDVYAQMGLSTQVRMGNSSGNPTIEFGSAFDTRIYRSAAGYLATDGHISFIGNVDHALTWLDGTGQYGAIRRIAATGRNEILAQTDITLAAGKVWFTTNTAGATGALDTGLYRAGAGSLRTDASLGVQVTAGFTVDSAGAVHGTSFPVSSDERLKTDIAPLDDSLDKLLRLRGVSFLWREDHGTHRDYTKDADREITPRQIGVIAQDVLAEFPEIVHQWPVFAEQYDEEQETTLSVETGETRYAVDYGRVVPILIEALREVDERLHVLEEKK